MTRIPNIIPGAVEKISPDVRCKDCDNDGWVLVSAWMGKPVDVNIVVPCPRCEIGERHNRNKLVYDRHTGKHTPNEIPLAERFWSRFREVDIEWHGKASWQPTHVPDVTRSPRAPRLHSTTPEEVVSV